MLNLHGYGLSFHKAHRVIYDDVSHWWESRQHWVDVVNGETVEKPFYCHLQGQILHLLRVHDLVVFTFSSSKLMMNGNS